MKSDLNKLVKNWPKKLPRVLYILTYLSTTFFFTKKNFMDLLIFIFPAQIIMHMN